MGSFSSSDPASPALLVGSNSSPLESTSGACFGNGEELQRGCKQPFPFQGSFPAARTGERDVMAAPVHFLSSHSLECYGVLSTHTQPQGSTRWGGVCHRTLILQLDQTNMYSSWAFSSAAFQLPPVTATCSACRENYASKPEREHNNDFHIYM